jgi:AAA domain
VTSPNEEAPAETGASREDLGKDSEVQCDPINEPDGGVAQVDSELEAAFKIQTDLLLEIRRRGGGLQSAGAFEKSTLRALAKTFAYHSDVAGLFTARARKAGADAGELDSLVAAVHRIQTGRALRLIPAEEVITMPPPAFLIDGLVPEGAAAVLYGASGLGKTFVVIDFAACIASGIPWLGHVVKQGPVIYVAAEGLGGLNKRLAAWKLARGVEILSDLYVVPDAVNLLDDVMVGEVIELAVEVNPILVVFDTHARCMVGGDESSAKDTGLVIAQLDRVRAETGAGTLSIHHTDKKGRTERGSGALRGAVDTMMELDSTRSGLFLTCDKQRNFQEFAPVRLQMLAVGDSLVPELGSGAALDRAASDSPYRGAIEAALTKAHQSGLMPMSQNAVLEAVGGNAAKVTAELKALAYDPSSSLVMANCCRSLPPPP